MKLRQMRMRHYARGLRQRDLYGLQVELDREARRRWLRVMRRVENELIADAVDLDMRELCMERSYRQLLSFPLARELATPEQDAPA